MAVLQTNLEFSKRKEDNCYFIASAFYEDSYYSNHIGAITEPELNSLVAEAQSDISEEQTEPSQTEYI